MVPRQRRLTTSPRRPTCVYSIAGSRRRRGWNGRRRFASTRPVPLRIAGTGMNMKHRDDSAGIPAPIRVASTPKPFDNGPTIAKDKGRPAVGDHQSRLATRPRSSSGTSRCNSVYQTTTNTAIDPSATKPPPRLPHLGHDAEARGHQHARAPTPGRGPSPPRGSLPLPTEDQGHQDRSDPARPEHDAEGHRRSVTRSLRTTYGTSVSHGPHVASRLTVAASNAIRIHRSFRT